MGEERALGAGENSMNDTIRVGDRVEHIGFGQRVVIAIVGDQAWIRDGNFDVIARTKNLTRIEPEKVTLTPKYKKDERVRTKGGREITVDRVFIGYESQPCLEWWEEGQLEPVPEPCPECKGSGVASDRRQGVPAATDELTATA
jgi:hypothetical protein